MPLHYETTGTSMGQYLGPDKLGIACFQLQGLELVDAPQSLEYLLIIEHYNIRILYRHAGS